MANGSQSKETAPKLVDTVFPGAATLVFWAAIAVGAGLIGLALFGPASSLVISNLVLSVGLGILLAAFGSQATVTLGGMILAGAGAAAIALFITLQNYVRQDDYVRVQISDLSAREYEPIIRVAFQDVFGRFVPASSHYEAVLFRRDLTAPFVVLQLQPKQGESEPEIWIPRANVLALLGSGDIASWRFDPGSLAIVDVANNEEIARTTGRTPAPVGPVVTTAPRRGFGLVTSAAAGQALAQPAPRDVGQIVSMLDDPDAMLRRAGRDLIAAADPAAVLPPLMEVFRSRFEEYRIRLGVVVGLAGMIGSRLGKDNLPDPAWAAEIGRRLTDEDIRLLVSAAADPDDTVRLYATEFLRGLADPRTVRPAIDLAATTTNDDIRYNLLFLSQGGLRELPPDVRRTFTPAIEAITRDAGPATRSLIQQLPR